MLYATMVLRILNMVLLLRCSRVQQVWNALSDVSTDCNEPTQSLVIDCLTQDLRTLYHLKTLPIIFKYDPTQKMSGITTY